MADDLVTRKVAAILAADAVGFTRLMADDEPSTMDALDAARTIFVENVESNQGRVVDTAGDSVLAVFETTEGAVLASVSIQDRLARFNEPLVERRRMRFRIGLHLGDIREKSDGTVYGDGVNVAARLQSIAEPGEIIASDSVQGALRGHIDAGFVDAGAHAVKNVAEPVHAFRVTNIDTEAPLTTRRLPARGVLAVTAVAIALAVGTAWWIIRAPSPAIAPSTDGTPATDSGSTKHTGPSIAVLPFTNMSDDAGQEYFADGISEDLITELSRFDGLLVIARNSTFRFKGQAVDVSEIAKVLGVRYVLEGGVRRTGDRVRITAQLIDAETGGHLWAERYDRELTDVFEVQDDVTRQIIAALQTEIGELTPTRGNRALTTSHEAYDLFLRARVEKVRRSEHTNARAQDLLRQAIALDPIFAAAYAEMSDAQYLAFIYGWHTPPTTLEDALVTAVKAVALDSSLPLAQVQLGRRQMWLGRYEESMASINQAIKLDANYAAAYAASAYLHSFTGDYALSLAMAEKASALDPYAERPALYRGMVYFAQRDYEAAIAALNEGVALNPDFGALHQWLAAAHSQLGQEVEARAEAAAVIRHSPNYAGAIWSTPLQDRSVLMRWIDGMRMAGLKVPDEPAAAE
jgi:adenylate cyclase